MTFNENTNRNKARTWTIVIHVLLLLWFAFTGLKYQDPPPEEGIAINFGYEETGKGDNSQAAAVTPPPPTPVETPVAAPVAQEEVSVMLFEQKTTLNTGDAQTSNLTRNDLDKL